MVRKVGQSTNRTCKSQANSISLTPKREVRVHGLALGTFAPPEPAGRWNIGQ